MGLSFQRYYRFVFKSRAKIGRFFFSNVFLTSNERKRKRARERDRDTVNYYIISHYEITFRRIVRMHTRQEFKLRLRDDTWSMRGLNRLLCLLHTILHTRCELLVFLHSVQKYKRHIDLRLHLCRECMLDDLIANAFLIQSIHSLDAVRLFIHRRKYNCFNAFPEIEVPSFQSSKFFFMENLIKCV